MDVSIAGLDKAELLAALYNGSQPLGMGFLHYDPADMTAEQAQAIIFESAGDTYRPLYFDYLKGRVMKVDLSGDEMSTAMYDRDNGQGAAEEIINGLRAKAALR